jgi:hypothetical protein
MSSLKTGMIYQIYYINNPTIHYIGSSMNNEIKYRWRDHKADFHKYLQNPNNKRAEIYKYFKEFGIENFTIKKLKDINVIDRDHLKVYEQLKINKTKPVNKVNPFNILSKEDKKNYKKQYQIKNKEKIQEYCKQRYQNNKEYFENYKTENKEKITDYKHEYYLKQKENNTEQYQKLEERANKIIKCDICNIETKQKHMKKHLETKKHLDNEKGIKIDYSNDPNKKLCKICNCYTTKKHFKEHLSSKKHLANVK